MRAHVVFTTHKNYEYKITDCSRSAARAIMQFLFIFLNRVIAKTRKVRSRITRDTCTELILCSFQSFLNTLSNDLLHQYIQYSYVFKVLRFTFDLVFLKLRYFYFFKIDCVHVTVIWNICKYQVRTAMGLGFLMQFTVKSHFTCIDEATSSNMSLLNSLHLLI
jgi:hypothetical protein